MSSLNRRNENQTHCQYSPFFTHSPLATNDGGRHRVTFSITMFIALLGFMTGLNDLLDGLILNRTPHIRLFNDIKPTALQPLMRSKDHQGYYPFISSVKSSVSRQEIYNSSSIQQALKADDRVLGYAPKITRRYFSMTGTSI